MGEYCPEEGSVNGDVRFGAPEKEKEGKGAGGRGEATAGEPVLAKLLWGMLYANDTGVVSQSPSS